MKSNNSQPIYVKLLRWLAVLPGSFIFALLMDFPIHWIVMLKSYNPDEPNLLGFITLNPATLEYLAYALFNPLFMIMASAYIAPCKKFITGLVMAAIIVCTTAFSYLYRMPDTMGIASLCLRIGLNILGIAIALVIVYRNEYRNSNL